MKILKASIQTSEVGFIEAFAPQLASQIVDQLVEEGYLQLDQICFKKKRQILGFVGLPTHDNLLVIAKSESELLSQLAKKLVAQQIISFEQSVCDHFTIIRASLLVTKK